MAASRRIEDVLHEMGLGHLVAKFQEQQVTAEMVPLLNEEELSSLGICLIGQRYELKRLCTVSATCTSKDENSDILQLMRQIGAKRTVTTKPKQRPLSTKSSAVHDEVDHMKMIKFLAGWKHRDSESDRHEGPYKHMYIQKGGGTYSLEGDAEDDWDFMLARLKSLFFPNGKNGPFSLEELKCSLGNYVGDEIPRVSKSQDGSAQPFQLSTYSLLTGKQKIRIYLLTSSIKPKKKSRKRGAHTVTIPDDSDDDDFLLVNPFTAHANDRPTKTTKPDDPEISIDPDISIDPEISIGMPHTGPNLDALTPYMSN